MVSPSHQPAPAPHRRFERATCAGFTLVELIIVIALMAVIASAVFIAIDPARRLHAARNSTRWTDVHSIVEAVKTYQTDQGGELPRTPSAIDNDGGSVQMIGEGGRDCRTLRTTCRGVTFPSEYCFASGLDTDLSPYLKRIPEDPATGTDTETRYTINLDEDGFIVVGACDEEGEEARGGGVPPVIEVSR